MKKIYGAAAGLGVMVGTFMFAQEYKDNLIDNINQEKAECLKEEQTEVIELCLGHIAMDEGTIPGLIQFASFIGGIAFVKQGYNAVRDSELDRHDSNDTVVSEDVS